MKLWDLNVWFVDFGLDDFGQASWADTITINPAIYIVDGDAVNHIYTGIKYECSADETSKIRAFRNEMEYVLTGLILVMNYTLLTLAVVYRNSLNH